MTEKTSDGIFQFPMGVVRTRSPEDLRRVAVERRVFDEAELQKFEPFMFGAEISNNRLDSHFTRMAQSTLKNFAADAQEGVAFLYSHDKAELVGRSMGGEFVGGQGNGVARVTADFYVIPGLQLGTVQSDQIIRAIQTLVLRDVSVGFYGGEWICSICGNDIWDYNECRHYPGIKFEVQADGKTEEVMCTADVEDARLAETSGVYKGSTPGAMIEKANRQAVEGLLKPEIRQVLERRLMIHLPEKRVSAPGADTSREEKTMADESKNKKDAAAGERAADPPAKTGATDSPPASGTAGTAGGAEGGRQVLVVTPEIASAHQPLLRSLASMIGLEGEGKSDLERAGEIVTLARDGRQYKSDLVTEALAEGVRANGAEFNQDSYRGLLERSEVATIKLMRDDWKRQAGAKFGGGRQTSEAGTSTKEGEDSAPQTEAAALPDSAHEG